MEKESQSIFDLIRLIPLRSVPVISDAEAGALYGLWAQAAPGAARLVADMEDKEVRSLMSKGYVRSAETGIELTDKGRQVIVEMVTHIPNALDKNATMPSYRDIKSKMARSGRQTFIKKANSERKVYNHYRRNSK